MGLQSFHGLEIFFIQRLRLVYTEHNYIHIKHDKYTNIHTSINIRTEIGDAGDVDEDGGESRS